MIQANTEPKMQCRVIWNLNKGAKRLILHNISQCGTLSGEEKKVKAKHLILR